MIWYHWVIRQWSRAYKSCPKRGKIICKEETHFMIQQYSCNQVLERAPPLWMINQLNYRKRRRSTCLMRGLFIWLIRTRNIKFKQESHCISRLNYWRRMIGTGDTTLIWSKRCNNLCLKLISWILQEVLALE